MRTIDQKEICISSHLIGSYFDFNALKDKNHLYVYPNTDQIKPDRLIRNKMHIRAENHIAVTNPKDLILQLQIQWIKNKKLILF